MSEDIRSRLLEALASPDGTGTLPIEDLLMQLGEANPTVRLIAKILARPQLQELESKTPTEDKMDMEPVQSSSELDETKMRASEMSRTVHQLRQKVDSMFRELAELRNRNDALAMALGACHLCWGDDPECEMCHGRGRTGSTIPDKKLFTEFAGPAAHRLQRGEAPTPCFSKKADRRLSPNQSIKPNERREL